MDGSLVNGLDIAVGIVLLISALLAFLRGFVHEVLSIAAWVGALLASVYGTALARPVSHAIIPIEWAADAVVAIIIFLVVLFVLSMGTHAMARTIQASALNNLDRSLGFIFGLARAMVILAVGLLLMNWLVNTDGRPDWMAQAKTLPLIEMTADGMLAIVPEAFLAAGEMADSPAQQLEQAAEAKEAVEKLANQMEEIPGVDVTGGVPQDGKPGYSDQDRDSLDALIEDAGRTQ
jgi:membrane protein required for colicin V production